MNKFQVVVFLALIMSAVSWAMEPSSTSFNFEEVKRIEKLVQRFMIALASNPERWDEVPTVFKWKPLHHAVLGGSTDNVWRFLEVRDLLECPDTEVDARDIWGETPLCYAVRKNDYAVTRLLLEHRANPNVSSFKGCVPVRDALYKHFFEIAELLVSFGAQFDFQMHFTTFLNSIASVNDIDVARFLLAHGVDVNSRDCFGVTPLHWAARGSYEVAQLLLAHGADYNIADRCHETPFDVAQKCGHTQIARLISCWPAYHRLWKERYPLITAFCCAFHPRLGSSSVAHTLPPDLFNYIGELARPSLEEAEAEMQHGCDGQ